MSYLLSQIWICLLLAALIGGIIGWFLRGGCRKKLEAVEADWRNRFAGVEHERDEMSSRLGNLDKISRERDQLQKELSSLRGVKDERDDLVAKLVALEASTSTISSQPTDTSSRLKDITDDTQDSYEIEEIEGIGTGYGTRLRNMDIATTGDLLKQCPNVSGIKTVASDIQLESDVVRSWSSMADLMRVRGIGGQYAELLEFSGVHTVQSLAESDASGLTVQLADTNAKENRVRNVPDVGTVSAWIDHAKTLPQVLDDDIITLKPGSRTISDTVMIADMDVQAAIAGLEEGDDNQSSYDIEEIEGIGRGYGKKLRGMGIATTTHLLDKCPDTPSMQPVIQTMNLEDWVIRSWVSMADLMRVRGIDGQYAELLNFSDIHSVQALANANAAGLAAKLKQVNDKEHRVKEVPDTDTIAGWIDQAKTLPTLLNLG
ncbi:MAG TPA: DUF4332 domain-containing protein [Chromatiales bacterium]|nr:DUF4332 domain-containing protein [Thiotrichales bacterium]HIP67637.1 DUF4332 domain-containing protein [Chromatiales bacterium]